MAESYTLDEAAEYVGVPAELLRHWASMNIGPKHTGHWIRPTSLEYLSTDLDEWLSDATGKQQ